MIGRGGLEVATIQLYIDISAHVSIDDLESSFFSCLFKHDSVAPIMQRC
jgi:hypothetical protein